MADPSRNVRAPRQTSRVARLAPHGGRREGARGARPVARRGLHRASRGCGRPGVLRRAGGGSGREAAACAARQIGSGCRMTARDRLVRWLNRHEQAYASSPFSPRWLARRRLTRFVRRNAARMRGTVLEIGSGDRKWAPFFPGRYLCLDHPGEQEILPHAERPDVWGDALSLPFADGSVDVILCSSVIEHVTDPAALARECARVLRPGGTLLLQGPGDLLMTHGEPRHFYNMTRYAYRHLFSTLGLRVEEEEIPLGTFASLWEIAYDKITRHAGFNSGAAAKILQCALVAATAPFVPFVSLLAWAVDAAIPADGKGYTCISFLARKGMALAATEERRVLSDAA
ncbi:MAG: class I SAM-dependent methyltransferase [Planctomycetes bacterium]|nr:class I SAM-dependent methyltransferase [Planctomycetota bacterium]